MASTPLKRIRVDDDLWKDFGEAAAAMGADRTKLLVAFMRRYVAAVSVDQSAGTDQGGAGRDSAA